MYFKQEVTNEEIDQSILAPTGGGILLSQILGSTSSATTAARKNNIKSHGVFQGNNSQNSQEVMLDATDLVYLANECDKLDSIIAGLSLQQDANVRYEYHHHVGSSTAYGGCYTSGYHTHIGSETSYGGCHTVGYHVHTSSCPHIHVHNSSCPSHHTHTSECSAYKDVTVCSGCNRVWAASWLSSCPDCGEGPKVIKSHYYNCKNLPVTYDCDGTPNTYTCGNPNNRWSLGCNNLPINRWATTCGRREGEIIKATIDF